MVDIRRTGFEHLAPGDGEQAVGQFRTALGSLADHLCQFAQALLSIEFFLKQFGVALYHRQQVVEIMGHTTRELAQGFQALGLTQLILQSQAIRDIGADAKYGAGITLFIADQAPVRFNGKRAAILAALLQAP